jgi:hypothetical protein
MNEKDFELLVESIQEGGKILRKEKEPARTFVFSPPDIKGIRKNVKATATYHPSMVYDAIMYCLDVAEGRKSDAFHTASKPTSVVIPSVLVDKSNVMDYYDPDSVF